MLSFHMNGERLRLGAFGVGRMGQVHLEHLIALHQAGEIELVAVGGSGRRSRRRPDC
jgi:hypothetical protein